MGTPADFPQDGNPSDEKELMELHEFPLGPVAVLEDISVAGHGTGRVVDEIQPECVSLVPGAVYSFDKCTHRGFFVLDLMCSLRECKDGDSRGIGQFNRLDNFMIRTGDERELDQKAEGRADDYRSSSHSEPVNNRLWASSQGIRNDYRANDTQYSKKGTNLGPDWLVISMPETGLHLVAGLPTTSYG